MVRVMRNHLLCITSILLTLPVNSSRQSEICLEHCTCDYPYDDGKLPARLICSGHHFDDNFLFNLHLRLECSQLTVLNVSVNDIREVSSLHFPGLRKLDLSRNEIYNIHIDAFREVVNLQSLDLSSNKLRYILRQVFEPLRHLQRLKLRDNLLTKISYQFFNVFPSLKSLDISDNLWHCDCVISWLSEWIRNVTVKVTPQPKCHSPDSLKGEIVKKLRLACPDYMPNYELGPLIPEIEPAHTQIVFEGDSLDLRCRSLSTSYHERERVSWTWNEQDPRQHFSQVLIEDRNVVEDGIKESVLRIEKLHSTHSGKWVCSLISILGNHSASVSVIVISEDTTYCPQTVTKNNKGVYYWPKTIIGYTLDFPCAVEKRDQRNFVRYTCGESGIWENLNTSTCPFVSETTSILEQFYRDNTTSEGIMENAVRLKNFTSDVKMLRDIMDVTFIAETIQKYTFYVARIKELGPVLLDIVETLLKLPQELLKAAQREHQSCSRVLGATEQIAQQSPAMQVHRSLLAVEEFAVNPATFSGIACTWTTSLTKATVTREFHCVAGASSHPSTNRSYTWLNPYHESVATAGTNVIVNAHVHVPSSVFAGVLQQETPPHTVRQLVISMYHNAGLFPDVGAGDQGTVVSSVVGANFLGLEMENLTEPVYLTLRVPNEDNGYNYPSNPKPVWWHMELNNGSGGWAEDGCQFSEFSHESLFVFQCHRLGYFGLLQDNSFLKRPSTTFLLNNERLGHPALYTGSFVLVFCFSILIFTYCTCHTSIQMTRRAKHAIVNTWISINLLCILFSFGINRTEERKICEGIGVLLHYLTLTTLLWMCVTASNMYKHVSKSTGRLLERGASDDELPSGGNGVPLQKPMLGLYLVGWGIALIVCGISGAVNLREYRQPGFCFLGSGPALTALFVPVAMLITFLGVFFFLTLCAIRSDGNAQLSEGTQGTENVDLELLDVTVPPHRSAPCSVLTCDSEDVDDPEHSAIVQLKAHIIVFVLYVLLWLVAAIFTTDGWPWASYISHTNFTAAIYCLISFVLAVFVLYFYGVARSDVRHRWGELRILLATGSKRCCRSRSVSDTHTVLPLQQQHTTALLVQPTSNNVPPTVAATAPVAIPALSSSSINSSSMKSTSNSNSHRMKMAAHKLNGSAHFSEESTLKPANNVNLVALHRQIYRSNNSMPTYHEVNTENIADAFYNPRQSIVARKFFRKQRRLGSSGTNTGVMRGGLRRSRADGGGGGGTSDGECCANARTWRPSAESAVFLSSDMEAPPPGDKGKEWSPLRKMGESGRASDESKVVMIDRLVIGAELDKPGNGPLLGRVEEESDHRIRFGTNASPTSSREALNPSISTAANAVDYRSVQLQCSLGEPSCCSDINTEDSHGECSTDDVECPEDCACAGQQRSSFASPFDSPSPIIGEEDSVSRTNLRLFHPPDNSSADHSDCLVSPEALPQFVTLQDPQHGLATLNLAEFVKDQTPIIESPTILAHPSSSSDSESNKVKKETSV